MFLKKMKSQTAGESQLNPSAAAAGRKVNYNNTAARGGRTLEVTQKEPDVSIYVIILHLSLTNICSSFTVTCELCG